MALTNALGALGAVYYIGCYLVAIIAPSLYKSVAQSWFHMIDLSNIWKTAPDGLVLGLVSFIVISWVSGWVLAFTYNSFLRK